VFLVAGYWLLVNLNLALGTSNLNYLNLYISHDENYKTSSAWKNSYSIRAVIIFALHTGPKRSGITATNTE
jgi:hypothetical protein